MIKLDESVTILPQINASYESLLSKLGIVNIRDLLTHFPRRYSNNTNLISIKDLKESLDQESSFLVRAYIKSITSVRIRGGRTLQTAVIEDETGSLKCTWFNQPYLKDVLKLGHEFFFLGKAKFKGKKVDFYPNIYEPIIEQREAVHLNRLTPEYQLTEGISKKWFRNRMKWLIDHLDEFEIKDELAENKLIKTPLKKNLKNIHFPADQESFFESIKEVSLYELADIHLRLHKQRENRKTKSIEIKKPTELIKILSEFNNSLSFELTNDQKLAIREIVTKIIKEQNLNLLLQGDVGSGKTIVAISASLVTAKAGYQTVILAPTTILAKQHYNTFSSLLSKYNLKIRLVTAETDVNERADIVIGTTAVLSRKASIIKNPGLIVVDEQHKFGVKQREELLSEYGFLRNEKFTPHLINMSATPIPRSVLQIFFGEIDVFRIKEKPKDRLPIKTFIVSEYKREDSLDWIKSEIKNGNQVYWVCSLITESENTQVKSAEKTFDNLKKHFGKEVRIGLLHGKMKEEEKIETTKAFSNGEIDILVSTTVIEVGIDVPNANIVIIEDADRFGLSQLHQIRGRVGRGAKESWCFLYASENITDYGINRLKFLTEHDDGFEIAEFDLSNRGPGEIYGVQQAGVPNLKIADLSDIENIKKSKNIAQELIKKGTKDIQLFKWEKEL